MLRIKFLLSAVFILGSNSMSYAEEIGLTNRELRTNNISVSVDFFANRLSPLEGLPFLGLEYNKNLGKNLSVGVGIKTIILKNSISGNTRYYFNSFGSKSSDLYVQGEVGYSSFGNGSLAYASTSTTEIFFLTPSIGYEYRSDNGFTFNLDLGTHVELDINGRGPSFFPLKSGVKVGYSF